MTNWNELLNSGIDLKQFATGKASGRDLERQARFTKHSRQVRNLLRNGGVNRARQLTRKALRRRGVTV